MIKDSIEHINKQEFVGGNHHMEKEIIIWNINQRNNYKNKDIEMDEY